MISIERSLIPALVYIAAKIGDKQKGFRAKAQRPQRPAKNSAHQALAGCDE
jgi:hypothetical protein